jgi:hypothetical protein
MDGGEIGRDFTESTEFFTKQGVGGHGSQMPR